MAKVTYIGPGPAEVFPYMYVVKSDGGTLVKGWGHTLLNYGVPLEVKEPENLATFLKRDRASVKVEASKSELAAVEEYLNPPKKK